MSDKAAIVTALRAELTARLDELRRSQAQAADAMRVDGDHRPANRGERGAVTAAGYLTAGLEARRQQLVDALALLDRVGDAPRAIAVTGALVEVEVGEAACWYYIFPGSAGARVGRATVVSPEAPVGRALWGRQAGDEVRLPAGDAEITAVE